MSRFLGAPRPRGEQATYQRCTGRYSFGFGPFCVDRPDAPCPSQCARATTRTWNVRSLLLERVGNLLRNRREPPEARSLERVLQLERVARLALLLGAVDGGLRRILRLENGFLHDELERKTTVAERDLTHGHVGHRSA